MQVHEEARDCVVSPGPAEPREGLLGMRVCLPSEVERGSRNLRVDACRAHSVHVSTESCKATQSLLM